MATASLIMGLIGLFACLFVVPSMVAMGLGVAGVVATNRARGALRGRGLAWAGLATGAVGAAAGVFLIAVVSSSEFQRGLEEGLSSGYVGIAVGDCIDTPDTGVVDRLEERPCAAPHGGEVFVVAELPDGPFPGNDEVMADVNDHCVSAFESYTGVRYEDSPYELWTVSPHRANWSRGQRRYACAVVTRDGGDLPPGSVRGHRI
ncbi:MAG: septum formation family protein [Acidimicrobiales bacterium]